MLSVDHCSVFLVLRCLTESTRYPPVEYLHTYYNAFSERFSYPIRTRQYVQYPGHFECRVYTAVILPPCGGPVLGLDAASSSPAPPSAIGTRPQAMTKMATQGDKENDNRPSQPFFPRRWSRFSRSSPRRGRLEEEGSWAKTILRRGQPLILFMGCRLRVF